MSEFKLYMDRDGLYATVETTSYDKSLSHAKRMVNEVRKSFPDLKDAECYIGFNSNHTNWTRTTSRANKMFVRCRVQAVFIPAHYDVGGWDE